MIQEVKLFSNKFKYEKWTTLKGAEKFFKNISTFLVHIYTKISRQGYINT